ncbi:carbohydrate binding-domain-containing protein [Mycena belliarum]|uniref:Carbohydrate binding-domain-containing protein n=1 Tax=Mycena belliarum TaxID=1033014 RepID=A0AAD6XNX2_9AGAR|nr:carbohydrate binding-domain-containing protein [Mycena belliae]
MARLLSIVLSAVLASLVAAESLSRCGSSSYYPSQYTCFNDNFLCPIVNGDRTIRCGDACYSTSLYSCSGTTLEPINTSGPETLEDCGPSRFYPSQYVCLDGNFLCPIIGGAATLRCGAACYAPSEYMCAPVLIHPPAALNYLQLHRRASRARTRAAVRAELRLE